MRKELGGGYPEKVDKMITKYGKGTRYLQHTGGDEKLLLAAIKSGRMPSITYCGYDPHYNGPVSHMVHLVYADAQWWCISDNNFPKDNQFVWMGRDDFLQRWKGNSGGWAVFLLQPPASPVPHN